MHARLAIHVIYRVVSIPRRRLGDSRRLSYTYVYFDEHRERYVSVLICCHLAGTSMATVAEPDVSPAIFALH